MKAIFATSILLASIALAQAGLTEDSISVKKAGVGLAGMVLCNIDTRPVVRVLLDLAEIETKASRRYIEAAVMIHAEKVADHVNDNGTIFAFCRNIETGDW